MNSSPWVVTLRVVLLALLAASGCARGHVHQASRLSADLQAPPVANVQTLDLSRLSGPPVAIDQIHRGDVVEVSIAAGLDADAVTQLPVRVNEDGMALLPEVGLVPLAGLSLNDAEHAIAAACTQRGFYRQPQVTVTMRQQRLNRITVVGAVKQPGTITLPRGSSYILSALMAAGGLDEDAGPKVDIRCPTGPTALADQGRAPSGVQLASGLESQGVTHVCLNLLNPAGPEEGGRYLPDGSVVTVEKRQPQPYQVIGLVSKPGEYEFPLNHEVRVLAAIAQAGGLSESFADKVYVIRSQPNGQGDAVIEVSVSQAKHDPAENLRLQPGDIVSVEHSPTTMVVEILRVLPFHLGASIPVF